MLSVTQDQLYGWLTQFMWPFVRVLSLFAVAPLFGESSIPRTAKIGLAAVFAVAIAPSIPPIPVMPPGSYTGLLILAQQVMIGIAIGYTMRIVFSAVQTAGEFVGLQMGLSFATFFDPSMGANTAVLSRLFNIVAMLIFLAIDGHLLMLAAIVRTFETLPIGELTLHQNGWGVLVEWGSTIFSSGLLLALPLIAALLTINLALGILNRAAPQLSVFSVGFPISITVGVILLAIVLPQTPPFLEDLFRSGLEATSRVVDGFAGR